MLRELACHSRMQTSLAVRNEICGVNGACCRQIHPAFSEKNRRDKDLALRDTHCTTGNRISAHVGPRFWDASGSAGRHSFGS